MSDHQASSQILTESNLVTEQLKEVQSLRRMLVMMEEPEEIDSKAHFGWNWHQIGHHSHEQLTRSHQNVPLELFSSHPSAIQNMIGLKSSQPICSAVYSREAHISPSTYARNRNKMYRY
jgi:hypothetical protein